MENKSILKDIKAVVTPKPIELNLDLKINNRQVIRLMQGYNYALKCNIFDNGELLNIEGATVNVHMLKADKKFIIQSNNISKSGNAINAQLDKDFTRINGFSKLQIVLSSGGNTFGSWAIDVIIDENVINDNDGKSENKVTITETLLDTIKKAEREVKEYSKNAIEEMLEDGTISNTLIENNSITTEKIRDNQVTFEKLDDKVEKIIKDNNKELIDGREATTKETFSSIGDRIDAEVERINEKIQFDFEEIEEGITHVVENTVAGRTKDMVIKGRTLKNLCRTRNTMSRANQVGDICISLKENTDYTVIVDSNTLNGSLFTTSKIYNDRIRDSNIVYQECVIDGKGTDHKIAPKELIKKYRTKPGEVWGYFRFGSAENVGQKIENIRLLEGDWTNKEIPAYFEGIKSAGEEENKIEISACSKNIFKKNKITTSNEVKIEDGEERIIFTDGVTKPFIYKDNFKYKTQYSICLFTNRIKRPDVDRIPFIFKYFDGTEKAVDVRTNQEFWFTTEVGKTLMSIESRGYIDSESYIVYDKSMIIESSSSTSVEKYKENKVLLSENIENGLISVGEEKDEIVIKNDGVYLIRRIGKIVLNGEERYVVSSSSEDLSPNYTTVYTQTLSGRNKINGGFVCSNFKYYRYNADFRTFKNEESCSDGGSYNRQYFRILSSRLSSPTAEGFQEWVEKNNITIFYTLLKPQEIKLMDITDINLDTYKTITNITSNNKIKPLLSFSAPIDKMKQLSFLSNMNRKLYSDNIILVSENENLKMENSVQYDIIDTTMLVIDKMLTSNVDSVLSSKTNDDVISKLYKIMIKRGLKDIDDIPSKYR